jgi:hypothetical protein
MSDRVAWKKNGKYVDYRSDMVFDTTAPKGHLPFCLHGKSKMFMALQEEFFAFSSLAQRLVSCSI